MTAGSGPLRVLVVDDEPAILRFLRAGLGSQGYVVVEASNGQSALDAMRQRRADLMVLDLGLPDMRGFAVAAEICKMVNPPSIVLMTADKREAIVWQANRLRLAGFLWKGSEHPDRVWHAVAEALAGRCYFTAAYLVTLRRIQDNPPSFAQSLSARELELIPLLGYGCSDEELAHCVELSAETIKAHRKHIMAKLDLHRSADLIRWAVQQGFCDLTRRCGRGNCTNK